MNRLFYTKLAITNIKNNKRTYIPYILTCIFTVMTFYMMFALSIDKGLKYLSGGQIVKAYLGIGNFIIAIFTTIFLFYTNNFLIKNRKKEFGLFNILGMGKNHIAIIVSIETLIIGVISLVIGAILGLLMTQVAVVLLGKILTFTIKFKLSFSPMAFGATCILFAVIFGLILLNNLRQIKMTKTIDLLKGGKVGEREPKTKFVMSILGIVCLGAGYYISINTKNVMAAIGLFFVAVILVIIGTYLLFTAASIFILKMLRNNKKYYYKPKNFISVSGMIYRMKQNAVGLGNICILSTMVLVTLSTTVSLYSGVQDLLAQAFPNDIILESRLDKYEEKYGDKADEKLAEFKSNVTKTLEDKKINDYKMLNYDFYSLMTSCDKDKFTSTKNVGMVDDKTCSIYFITQEGYNNNNTGNKKVELNDDEVVIVTDRKDFTYNDCQINDMKFKVQSVDKGTMRTPQAMITVVPSSIIVVKDDSVIDKISKDLEKNKSSFMDSANYLGIDVKLSRTEKMDLFQEIIKNVDKDMKFGYYQNKQESEAMFNASYGGLFFIGIFLGFLFIVATVLIMYYKQISEGYEDKTRFTIMQQVGMSRKEVKSAIHSQVIKIFFLPLIIAGIHTGFAFPIINRILKVIGLTNSMVFVKFSIITYLVFALFYVAVYGLTAKTYYKIVE